jgi:type IV fimbrial biogenesis protein FimT
MNSSRSHPAGFTLIELLIVITIVGVLTTMAIPSFKWLMESQRVSNASYELFSVVNLARSEAVKRNAEVKLKPVYTAGVITSIEVSFTSNGVVTVLASKAAPKGVEITPSASAAVSITYKHNGRPVEASPNFEIDVKGAVTPTVHVRCMTIGLSGMARTQKGACP